MSDPLLSKQRMMSHPYMVNDSEKSGTNDGGAYGQPVMMPVVLS
jgi:hypothetical protein